MMNRLSSLATISLALLMTLPMACGDDGGGDGGGGNGDGGPGVVDADPNVPRTAFRGTKMTLLDPHAFPFGNFDGTDQVNGQIADAIEQDMSDPADGILDLNVSFVFQPIDPAAASTPMAISFAECSAPLETTSCTQTATTELIATTATNESSATCLEALAGTTTEYDNMPSAVVPVPAPCFSSDSVDVTVNLSTVTLPLKSAQIGATYSGTPTDSLVTGLLRGYVTQADAQATIVPVPLLGDTPLADLLREQDMDTGPNGEEGWWFYIGVEAELVDYTIQ